MSRSFRLAVSALLVWSAAARSLAADTGSYTGAVWEQIRDEDGIRVYRWQPPGTSLFAFKADTIIESTVARIATVLVDVPRRKEWMPKLIEGHIVRSISLRERIEYMAVRTPPFVATRDFVFYDRAEFDKATGELNLRFTATEDPAAPEVPSMVRGRILDSTYTLRPANQNKATAVEMKVQIDPGGSVADWLVNFVQKNTPFNTLASVRKQVMRSDVVVLPDVKTVLEQ